MNRRGFLGAVLAVMAAPLLSFCRGPQKVGVIINARKPLAFHPDAFAFTMEPLSQSEWDRVIQDCAQRMTDQIDEDCARLVGIPPEHLQPGDVFTITGPYKVNPRTRQATTERYIFGPFEAIDVS
jgi:hypothetical protein